MICDSMGGPMLREISQTGKDKYFMILPRGGT